MENFAPGLRENILSLTVALRVVLFFICVAGLILQINRARGDLENLTTPIVRAIVVVALIATLPYWFEFTEKLLLSLADTVNDGYTQHPMLTAARLRETASGGNTEFSLRRIGESLYMAFLLGSMKLVVLVASLLQLPFLVLQFILKLLCYLFLPAALALFMLPSQAQLATRYVQQTIAVLSWPIGFAVTELVAYHLLTAYGQNLASAYGLQPGEIDAASFASLLGGLLAALWLILGTIATPFLMQALICSGSPLSGGSSAAMHQLYALHQMAWLVKTLKTGGAAAPALAASAATNSSAGGRRGGPGLPPLPPPPPPSTPSPAAPAPTAAIDPAGDRQAAAVLAQTQLPAPQTTI